MSNTYLKKFMPITWDADRKKITITFQAEIYDNQSLNPAYDRIGDGYALCIYKVKEDTTTPRDKLKLKKYTHHLKLEKDWDDDKHPDHITTLILLHNPTADNDSMTTADAPNM
ncbi:MAG: hypothetical protein P8100_13625 [bacterium]|jgi:hypothetical protein